MFENDIPLIFQLVLLAAGLGYAVMLFRSRLNPKVIRRSALVILACGILLYIYAFSLEDFSCGLITTFFRSMLLTIKMFVYDGDVFEIPLAQKQPYFMELYYTVFYAAMLTSVSAILMLFGKRAITWLTLFFRRRKFSHVFVGMDRRSQIIAGGINDGDIAFIEFPNEQGDSGMSVKSALKGLSMEEEQGSWKLGRRVAMLRAKRRFQSGVACDNVFECIGLAKLKRLVDKDTAFYILSEDEEGNLNDLMALLEDKDLLDNTIHVCVGREGVARYYKTTLKRTGVHFIYPSSMSVVELMKNPECHPAKLMAPDLLEDGSPSGAVSGQFTALVVGFGETGQAVAKFLYEFSAAVHKDGTPMPARIIVNDDRMDRLKGQFMFENPDLASDGLFAFENCGTGSGQFWDNLVNWLDSLNLIAISMNSDAMNLDLACTIFMYAMKKRRNGLDGLKILVRKRNTQPHETELVRKMNEKAGSEVIVCYGEYEKIFTPDMIVSKSRSGINAGAISQADMIDNAYFRVTGQYAIDRQETESYHAKSRRRMELHQLISRANHLEFLRAFVLGNPDVPASALENLARMEHIRYSRYLAAHGYSYSIEDDDLLKTSHQICPWENLTETDRRYHIDMVRAQLLVMDE